MSAVIAHEPNWSDFMDQHGNIDLDRAFQAAFPQLVLTFERRCFFHTMQQVLPCTSRQIASLALATAAHCIGSH